MLETPPSRSGSTPLEFARNVALEAGGLLLDRFETEKQIEFKGRNNIVTDVDRAAEELIIGRIQDEYPDCGILAEESGWSGPSGEFTWVIDPLDGTRNYAAGLPTYAVTLALTKGDNVLVGATYDPSRQEMFSAERGLGATCNELGVKASTVRRAKDSLIGLDLGYHDEKGGYAIDLLESVWPGVQGFRIMGSAALGLAYVAAGRLDAYIHHLLSPWDLVAGVVMAGEGGALVTNRAGNPIRFSQDKSIIAANPALHEDFMAITEGLKWRNLED